QQFLHRCGSASGMSRIPLAMHPNMPMPLNRSRGESAKAISDEGASGVDDPGESDDVDARPRRDYSPISDCCCIAFSKAWLAFNFVPDFSTTVDSPRTEDLNSRTRARFTRRERCTRTNPDVASRCCISP